MSDVPAAEYPILLFATLAEWAEWLERHHASAPGVWLHLAKANAPFGPKRSTRAPPAAMPAPTPRMIAVADHVKASVA